MNINGFYKSAQCGWNWMPYAEAYTIIHHTVAQATKENGFTDHIHSLHATPYPWVHAQWFKTFDHQAYVHPEVPPSRASLLTQSNTDSVVVSKSTKKFAHPATP